MEAFLPYTQKILIVDDAPSDLMVLGEALKAQYEVIVATNGEAALEKALSDPPDLILLDVMMSGLDGYEVCRRLKRNPVTRAIPVVFTTAKDAEEDEVVGLAAGAVDYVVKPFRLPILKARVKTHLELKRKTDILESLSFRDGLTGLNNRRRLDTVIADEWLRAIRNRRPLALVMLDLDFFKPYNDNYGHVSGDECLKTVAKALNETFRRAGDCVARYGGEEFAIVLAETTAEQLERSAENARITVEALQIKHEFSTVASQITASVGAASILPSRDSSVQELIEAADDALYEAKLNGRNRISIRKL